MEGVDIANRKLYVSSENEKNGKSVEYDTLVVATGADVNLAVVKGAEEYALPFYTVEDYFELKQTLFLFDSHDSSRLEGGTMMWMEQ